MSDFPWPLKKLRIPGLKAALFLLLLFGFLTVGLMAQEEDEEDEAVFKAVGIHVRL